MHCLPVKVADVRAVIQNLLTGGIGVLTTITPQEESGVFCAVAVTEGSGF